MDFKYFLLPLLLLAACNGTNEAYDDQQEVPDNEVWLSEAQLNRFSWRLDTLLEHRVGGSILVTGMIDVPPQYRALLHAPVPAYVNDIRVKVGQKVRKNEVLALLEHPDVLELQRRYLEASALFQFTELDYERQQALARDQATARRQLEKADADLVTARAGMQALEAQLQRLGISSADIRQGELRKVFELRAPFEGYITSVDAQLGQFVGPNQPMVGLLNKAHLHVELDVFEQDLPRIFNGQQLTFELTNLPGKLYTGDVFLIGQTLDAAKRTINVHGHIDQEEDPLLRPGLFVSARLLENNEPQAALPESAVVRHGNQFFGFRYLAPGKYERVALYPLNTHNGQTALRDAPALGSLWVSEGAHRLEAAWRARFEEDEGH
jgi:cobalt-zinc-cadmium efflux system membrane fusion protein